MLAVREGGLSVAVRVPVGMGLGLNVNDELGDKVGVREPVSVGLGLWGEGLHGRVTDRDWDPDLERLKDSSFE